MPWPSFSTVEVRDETDSCEARTAVYMLAFRPSLSAASFVLGLPLSLWTRITAIRCAEQSIDDGSSEVKGAVGDLLRPV